jgi:hypothetical protein
MFVDYVTVTFDAADIQAVAALLEARAGRAECQTPSACDFRRWVRRARARNRGSDEARAAG